MGGVNERAKGERLRRSVVLGEMRTAGFHGAPVDWLRLFIAGPASLESSRNAYLQGVEARLRGGRCGCTPCSRAAMAEGGVA